MSQTGWPRARMAHGPRCGTERPGLTHAVEPAVPTAVADVGRVVTDSCSSPSWRLPHMIGVRSSGDGLRAGSLERARSAPRRSMRVPSSPKADMVKSNSQPWKCPECGASTRYGLGRGVCTHMPSPAR